MFNLNKRKDSAEEKPWSNSFEESHSDSELSRAARHNESNDASLTTKILLVVFIVMLLSPIIYYFYDSQQRTNAIESQSKNEVLISKEAVKEQKKVQIEKEKELARKEEEKAKEAARKAKEQEEEEAKLARQQEELDQTAASQNEQAQASPNVAEQTTPNQAGYNNSYTVQAGDNLWRIAYSHGMTLDELKQVNGLPNNDAIIGMQLRVK
ncbi:LysM peptidoglycan-binding domain-containing protein [Atopobacter phocae]|uniref:LysM peptidoglycan-binding domain-containing protein n=1 Tax=Atopobacter phocae TaxID=136492 RepID=UPI00046FA649|nr:LysM domain-containing protein [Atopobacter phocae]